MSIELHLARRLVAWGMGIAALSPFLICLQPPPSPRPDLSVVTGRVRYSGHPITNMYICIDMNGSHSALGALHEDGSFRLVNFQYGRDGVFAGRYRAHLDPYLNAPPLPNKYGNSRTSGLEIDVAPDWNHVDIELH
jgi:hypothetical protein